MSHRYGLAILIGIFVGIFVVGCAPKPTQSILSEAQTPTARPSSCNGRFAFVVRTGDTPPSLYTVDACDGAPHKLPEDAGAPLDTWVNCSTGSKSTAIAWSPDGTRLIYSVSEGFTLHSSIRMANVETREIREITPISSTTISGKSVKQVCIQPNECVPYENESGIESDLLFSELAWSPDGKQIGFQAFYAFRSGERDMTLRFLVMNADGSNIRSLTLDENKALQDEWKAQMTPLPKAPPFKPEKPKINFTVECASWHP